MQAFIWRELGVTVHLHLLRHLAAMLWLHAEPGNYEIPRLLLGHSALSTTFAAYADFDQSAAVKLFADVLRGTAKR